MNDLHATFVVPTYNRASFIGECLQSIRQQTDGDWSVIVVDDCSSDGTRELLERLQFPHLRYVANDQQSGASESRDRALWLAEGGLIVFIDSDDRLHPTHLERMRAILRAEPELGMICCDARIIDTVGQPLYADSFQTLEAALKGYSIRSGRRSFGDIYVFSTTMPGLTVRRGVFDRIGGFDQDIFPVEDVDLQLRAAAAGVGIYYVHEVLADYRTHPGSSSAGDGKAVRTCTKKIECLSRWLEQAPPDSAKGPLRRRLADAHLELALASLRARETLATMRSLARALRIDPRVVPAFLLNRRRARQTPPV